jgi:hypothetical protein
MPAGVKISDLRDVLSYVDEKGLLAGSQTRVINDAFERLLKEAVPA